MISSKSEQAISDLLHNLQIDVRTAFRTQCPADWHDLDYSPDYNKFYFIIDGEGWIRVEDQQIHPSPGQLVFMPAYTSQGYSAINDKPFLKYWCHFTTRVGAFDLFQWIGVPYCIDIHDKERISELFEQLVKLQANTAIVSRIRQKSVMLELLATYLEHVPVRILQHRSEEINRLNVIHDYVDKHLHMSISVDELAALLHLHPNYFIAYFKKRFGISPHKYVNRLRVEKAKTLLMTTALSIKEISAQTGFPDTNHFTKLFRKETGFTPTAFRGIYAS